MIVLRSITKREDTKPEDQVSDLGLGTFCSSIWIYATVSVILFGFDPSFAITWVLASFCNVIGI
jgi:hypothetical protein